MRQAGLWAQKDGRETTSHHLLQFTKSTTAKGWGQSSAVDGFLTCACEALASIPAPRYQTNTDMRAGSIVNDGFLQVQLTPITKDPILAMTYGSEILAGDLYLQVPGYVTS